MTESPRTSALATRHRALGSGLEDWNGMGTAWTYSTDPRDEHDAVREAAGLFDMSPLKKVFLRGPDAGAVADHALSRDLSVIGAGRSVYGSVLSEQGRLCDDTIIANNSEDEWLLCHGSGQSMERLQESAKGRNVTVELDDDLHMVSLQGPRALALLDAHTPLELAKLKYFHHRTTELFGHPCRISRTGYSGERGYEILAGSSAVVEIWDNILGHGKDEGVMACSFTALDKVRIEAALPFFGYDMTEDHSPWEVGLGFTVSRKKREFRGRGAVFALEGKERFQIAGIVADHSDALPGGAKLMLGGDQVGAVNSPAWSHRMNKSLALVHLRPDTAKPGTKLKVEGNGLSCEATVSEIPFYDPEKKRVHA